MMQAKFELRDWMWNEPGITEQDPASILGMKWHLQTDTIAINVQSLKNIDEEKSITKRTTIKIKKMVQDAWKENKSWYEQLNEDRRVEFIKWRKQALELDQIKIPRWILPIKGRTTLHVFCDASAIAYATVIFMRIENASVIVVRFVEARNRLATIKRITIPRLELLACLIGARLLVHVLENLEESPEKIQCWTDSSPALYWIQQQENWAQFVSNRVKEITTLTKSEDWNHVAGEHNPADLPSRAIEEERRKNVVAGFVAKKPEENPWYLNLYEGKREVTLTQILRVIAWMLRFKPSKYKGDIISQEELDSAEKSLVKIIQSESIGEEDPKMKQLHAFQDKEGLWRVKTRIVNRNDDELFRLPILIPTNYPVTELIVKSVHEKMYHCGAQTLRSVLREMFWIPKARQLVRHVIHKCPRCRRFETKRVDVPEASLPQHRVRDVVVFEVTGIDLGGPLYLEDGQKVWFVIFTCGIYRAVHLELVTSLSTEALVGAVERFVARRGCPAVIYSDNGTNLVGLRNELYRVNFGVKWKLNPPAAPWWGEMFLREPRTEGEIDLNEFRCNFGKSYEKRKRLLKEFRKRFRSEYLGLLVHHDNRKKQRQLKVGDIFLVEVENRKQINWPMGKITKVFPGTDNVRRLVEVKTKSGFMKRAVQRLFPLEVPSEDVEQGDGELKPAEDEIVREKTPGVESVPYTAPAPSLKANSTIYPEKALRYQKKEKSLEPKLPEVKKKIYKPLRQFATVQDLVESGHEITTRSHEITPLMSRDDSKAIFVPSALEDCGIESADERPKLIFPISENNQHLNILAKSGYDPANIYNADETGLFFQLIPDRTLAHKDENCRGVKRMKQRITVLLCCNSTGTDKRRLLIIGKSANPRCFRNFSPHFYCTYTSNSKAWMTSSIFQEWLLQFNKQLVSEGRRILLLLDNATSHCVPNDCLSNIKIHFLPPNMTASLQPLDSGIIKSFKAQYRKLQLQKMVELADAHLPTELRLDYAVRYCKMAWDSVSPDSIRNCWNHTGIICFTSTAAVEPLNYGNLLDRIRNIFAITPENLMTEREFQLVDDSQEAEMKLTDDNLLVSTVTVKEELGEDDDATVTQRLPSLREARTAAETVLLFLEHSKRATSDDVNLSADLLRRVYAISEGEKTQVVITDFFKKM
ncbi:hypothetical protein LAZ67_17002284 [Cordylochernes scorpioides]|uniref:Integrase catalytic domain-containing protein n=1 Tax=Cordylochernes scorpioides TaxID=51811 RepID=A0ABY6LET3_9ARAC|nr:hypothetical protein LAZ67_17002284 [Cordylochernes scorpioides]